MSETTDTAEKKADPISTTLLDEFKTKVKASSVQVKEAVVKTMVDTELDNRASKIAQAIKKLSELKKDIAKIKPESTHNDTETLEPLPGKLTKDQAKKKKDLKAQVVKIDKALDLALDETNPDFQKLNEIVK